MMILADGHGLLDREAGLDAGALRHPDVEQHDVGRSARRELGALDAVSGLADDLDARLDGQQHRQPSPEQLLVVDHEHSDGFVSPTSYFHHARIIARCAPTGPLSRPPRSSEITP